MSATLTVPELGTQLQRFSPTDAAIAVIKAEYMPLAIKDVNDSAGYKLVHSARMVVKNHRVEVEKVRKALKADALEYGRKVDSEAKRITALLEPIESHLANQENAYEAEKERIKEEARLKAEAEAKARQEAEEARLRAIREAEEARLKAIRDAEEARLRAEREALDAERQAMEAKQKAEQEKIIAERQAIEAERKRLADIEAARLRAIEEDRIRKEAAERAVKETEARIAREAEQARLQAEAIEAERVRKETLRPDREKLLAVADAVAAIQVPTVSEDADGAAILIHEVLMQGAERIRSIVARM
jgi:hypothetical protein